VRAWQLILTRYNIQYLDVALNIRYESEEPEEPPESPIEEHHDSSEVPIWSTLSDGQESAEEDPPR
jgi:hypothetical protein